MTSDALTLPKAFELDVARDADYGPELTDADLESVVGGLARAWTPRLDDDGASDYEIPAPR
jgi:hypothetical protein